MENETAENGIRHALAEYCVLVDEGNFDAWSDLFTTTGALTANGALIARGRVEILRWIKEALPSRAGGKHVTVNSLIRVTGGSADVSSDFVYLAPSDDGPKLSLAGKYVDKLVREPDRWRFAEREILVPPGWVRVGAFPAQAPGTQPNSIGPTA